MKGTKTIGPRYYPSAKVINVKEFKAVRCKLRYTQETFAAKAGVALSVVRRAEQGKNIRIQLARTLADALGEPFSVLFAAAHPEIGPEGRDSLGQPAYRRPESGPSASEFVISRVQLLVSQLTRRAHEIDTSLEDLINESLTGRDQLLRPLASFFQTVAENSLKDASAVPRIAVKKAATLFLRYCHKAQVKIAQQVCRIVKNNDRGPADAIVLADFSVSIARSLRELARRKRGRTEPVNIYLVVSGQHDFPMKQDAKGWEQRWEQELTKQRLRRFCRIRKRVPFDALGFEFERIRAESRRPVVLMGIERAYPEGQFLDWPAMSAVFNCAAIHSFEVIVAAECYKVQPTFPGEIPATGISMSGGLTPLAPLHIGPGVYFVTDHAIHTVSPRNERGGTSFKCCHRFWRNQMETKQYPIGIVFDLDGTIIDSEDTHKTLYQDMSASLGYNLTDTQYFTELCGLTDAETFRRILRLAAKKGDPVKLATEKQQRFIRHLSEGILDPIPGVVEYVRELTKKGHLLALATSATRQEATLALRQFDLTSVFNAVITSQEVAVGKPEPDVYVKAVQALGVEPLECLVYEDSINGMIAARKAGIRVVAVGNAADGAARRAGAMMRIPDFRNHQLPVLKAL